MTYLADVNVWFALSYVAHVHYPQASAWFEEIGADEAAMCRVTQSALLRLLTNPKAMGADTLTAAEAWVINDKLQHDLRVTFAEEPPGLEVSWRLATKQAQIGPNFWTDAYLTAFAQAGGYTIVTFDKAFTRQRRAPVRVLASNA